MSQVVYRSTVRIERVKGPVRKAYLPAESEPVIFSVHGAVAEHYNLNYSHVDPRLARGAVLNLLSMMLQEMS